MRGNEKALCPVAGDQGRFRIVNGSLFSDSGREVWLTPQKKLSLGPIRDLLRSVPTTAVARCGDPGGRAGGLGGHRRPDTD